MRDSVGICMLYIFACQFVIKTCVQNPVLGVILRTNHCIKFSSLLQISLADKGKFHSARNTSPRRKKPLSNFDSDIFESKDELRIKNC